MRCPLAHHRVPAARDAPEHFQEAGLARSIDGARADDRDVQSVRASELAGHRVGLGLCLLIDVARDNRGVLIRGRILHIAVYTDGGGMDEPANAGQRGGLEEFSRAFNVDFAVVGIRMAGRAVNRGDVHQSVAPLREAAGGIRIAQRAAHDLRAARQQVGCDRALPY